MNFLMSVAIFTFFSLGVHADDCSFIFGTYGAIDNKNDVLKISYYEPYKSIVINRTDWIARNYVADGQTHVGVNLNDGEYTYTAHCKDNSLFVEINFSNWVKPFYSRWTLEEGRLTEYRKIGDSTEDLLEVFQTF